MYSFLEFTFGICIVFCFSPLIFLTLIFHSGAACPWLFLCVLVVHNFKMSKRHILAELDKSLSKRSCSEEVRWQSCIYCQSDTGEPLVSPCNSKHSTVGSGYTTACNDLRAIKSILGMLPREIIHLDQFMGQEDTLLDNKAAWHKSCR